MNSVLEIGKKVIKAKILMVRYNLKDEVAFISKVTFEMNVSQVNISRTQFLLKLVWAMTINNSQLGGRTYALQLFADAEDLIPCWF